MNRAEFMNTLGGLLNDISDEERNEALQFYENYFEDAGPENESQIIEELGSPQKVAAMIKTDLGVDSQESTGGEFTEHGYTDERFEAKEPPAVKRGPWTSTALKLVLIILIGLVAATFLWPVVAAIAAVVFGVLVAVFALFAGLVIGAVAIMLAGAAVVIAGLSMMFAALPTALLVSGTGVILFILGLMATVGTVKLCVAVYPALIRTIVNVCRWPFHRKAV